MSAVEVYQFLRICDLILKSDQFHVLPAVVECHYMSWNNLLLLGRVHVKDATSDLHLFPKACFGHIVKAKYIVYTSNF